MSLDHPLEVFLHPGDHYFADQNTRIRTVLGSCVAITLWHPHLRIGGMCHYMLPERASERRVDNGTVSDGRYADTAISLLLNKIDRVGVPYKEYHVKLFGGGNMFPKIDKNNMPQVGSRNVQAARRLVKQHRFTCVAEHLGGIGYRNVIFEVWSGEVWVRHSSVLAEAETGHELLNRRLG
jgi:chemotaxis protein CheD